MPVALLVGDAETLTLNYKARGMTQQGMWSEKIIKKWPEFEQEIGNKLFRNWLFRGHMNVEWRLESSLYRHFDNIVKILPSSRNLAKDDHEEELIRVFREHAPLYLNNLPAKSEKLEWLSIMQHYGTPTRLLDITFSPYVAAFFALEDGHDDCCVFAIKHKYFTGIDGKCFNDVNYKKRLFDDRINDRSFFIPYEQEYKTKRIVAQQGAFLISSTNNETYDEILRNYPSYKKYCKKYILKKNLRYMGLKKLKQMNITSATLFPGIDGFCRSLKLQLLDGIQRIKRLHT